MLPVVVVYSCDPYLAASSVLVHLAQTAVILEHVADLVAACLVRALSQFVVYFAGAADFARLAGVAPRSVPESVVLVAGMPVALQSDRAV